MKNSGIEWIGEIPEGWEVVKVKHRYKFHTGWTPPTGKEEMFIGENLWANISDLGENLLFDTAKRISDAAAKQYNIHLSKKDELMFSFKLSIGTVSFCGVEMYTNEAIATFEKGDNSLRFLFYAAPLFVVANANENIYGAKLLNQQLIRNAHLILPHLPKQQAIAGHLDKKCELIDRTIEKQKTVVEKLHSYKQSLITETVTKGLDPTVKMKPSGIEWIGDIPEGWEVRKLKYLGNLNANGVDKKIQDGEKLYKSVHYMNVYNNSLSEIKNSEDYLIISATDEKVNSCTLLKGDVLFTNSSETPDDMGHSTVVFENLNNTLFGYHLMRFRPKVEICLQFEKYLFGSYYMRKWFEYRSIGMTRYGVSYSEFANALIILPTLSEQQAIVDYLDTKCTQIGNAINNKQKLINKLTDYKKSLIYECVTGKKEIIVNA